MKIIKCIIQSTPWFCFMVIELISYGNSVIFNYKKIHFVTLLSSHLFRQDCWFTNVFTSEFSKSIWSFLKVKSDLPLRIDVAWVLNTFFKLSTLLKVERWRIKSNVHTVHPQNTESISVKLTGRYVRPMLCSKRTFNDYYEIGGYVLVKEIPV
jgi:hypothetical protein